MESEYEQFLKTLLNKESLEEVQEALREICASYEIKYESFISNFENLFKIQKEIGECYFPKKGIENYFV